jgi:hypothetical protein
MKRTFILTIKEVVFEDFEIEARSQAEAIKMLKADYINGDAIVDGSGYTVILDNDDNEAAEIACF